MNEPKYSPGDYVVWLPEWENGKNPPEQEIIVQIVNCLGMMVYTSPEKMDHVRGYQVLFLSAKSGRAPGWIKEDDITRIATKSEVAWYILTK